MIKPVSIYLQNQNGLRKGIEKLIEKEIEFYCKPAFDTIITSDNDKLHEYIRTLRIYILSLLCWKAIVIMF